MPLPQQMVNSTYQCLHDSLHFKLEKDCAHAVYRYVAFHNQCIDVQIITTQDTDHTLFFFSQLGEKISLYGYYLAIFTSLLPTHSPYKIGSIVDKSCFVVANQLVTTHRIGITRTSGYGKAVAMITLSQFSRDE